MPKFLVIILFLLASCKSEKDWVCVEGNCYNGIGKRIWKDGGYEKGTWRNGRLNGHGEQFFGKTSSFAGDTYSGEFKEDKYNGKGIYRDVSTASTYIGGFKDGQSSGFGIVRFDSGSKFPNQIYKGEWKNGKKEGYGTESFGTTGKYRNDKYVGHWKNDKMDGVGKYFWSSGISYEGQWQNNFPQGDGVRVDKNGKGVQVHCEAGDCSPIGND